MVAHKDVCSLISVDAHLCTATTSGLKPYMILSREEARSFKKAAGFPLGRNRVPCSQPVEVPRRSKAVDDPIFMPGGWSGPPGQLSTARQDRRGDIGTWHQACLVQSGDGWDFPNCDGCLVAAAATGLGHRPCPTMPPI